MSEGSPAAGLQFLIHHTMLPVADVERSVDFYTRFLGMTLKARRDRRKARVAIIGCGLPAMPPFLELIEDRSTPAPQAVVPLNTHIAVDVSDLRRLCHLLEGEGVPFTRPLTERPDGSGLRAWINDPDGNPIELAERPEP